MNEIGLVFVAEFVRKLRSRAFLFATLGGAFAIALLVFSPTMIGHLWHSKSDDVVVAGPAALRTEAAALLSKDYNVTASVERLPVPVTQKYLDRHGHASAALAVSVRRHRLHVDVYTGDLAAFEGVEFRSLIPLNYELATGVTSARGKPLLKIARDVHGFDTKFSDVESASVAHGVAFGLIFILYFAIILGSQSVMSSVAEEKTSRIAELLVAMISPVNLLTGKTLASAVLALLQISVWVSSAILMAPFAVPPKMGHELAGASPGATAIFTFDPSLLLAFFVFFALGYLQYATVYAAAASLISRTEDLGTVTTPVILPVVCAYFIAQFALLQPNEPASVAFSFVPFVSPFVIFTRIAVTTVPGWQVALAILINAIAIAVCFYAAGKVYRIGMLLYGKLPTPKQIIAALRT